MSSLASQFRQVLFCVGELLCLLSYDFTNGRCGKIGNYVFPSL